MIAAIDVDGTWHEPAGGAGVSESTGFPAVPAVAGDSSRRLRRAVEFMGSPAGLSALVAVVAAVVLWLVIQPLTRVTADTDAAACVMYFERIVDGHRLEAFFPTTPKPLLTIVYGLAWSLTHDWHSLAVMTLVVGSAAVGMAARMAARMGGLPAAAFVTVGLLAWPAFRLEVADANSFVWGLALWLLAALLITADRPRPWAAGFVLILAGLARTETIWFVVAAAACAAVAVFAAARGGDRSPVRLAVPPIVGAMAVPLACLHDLLLTGKPFYWLSVPGGYTVMAYPELSSASPLTTLHRELLHYLPLLALVVLGALGIAWLLTTRWRGVSFALVVLAGGVLGTLVLLAWRAVYISDRYYEEADAAMLLAAAVGGGLLLTRGADWVAAQTSRRGESTAADTRRLLGHLVRGGAAALLALAIALLSFPQGGVEPALARAGRGNAEIREAEPQLDSIVAGAHGDTMTVKGVVYPVADPLGSRVFVPRSGLPGISVDTGAPTPVLGDSWLAFRNGDYSVLSPGQYILHVAADDDGSGGIYAPFEHSVPEAVTGKGGAKLTLVPVFVDATAGVWLLRVDAAG
jgi:hypothetical protein